MVGAEQVVWGLVSERSKYGLVACEVVCAPASDNCAQ